MDKVIRRYLDGEFNYETGFVEFSCPRLELFLQREEIGTGVFSVQANEKQEIMGFVLSNQNRMTCNPAYFDTHRVEIEYCFDARGMEEGEVLQGEIEIVTSQGEYYLPYVVTVEYFKMGSSMGDIKNLFHFANLAKCSWEEALGLFYSERFAGIFRGGDKQYLNAYRLLCNKKGDERGMEEFLLEIRKKQPVEYTVSRTEIVIKNPLGTRQEKLEVIKSGWGCAMLGLESSGDFLSLEKDSLSGDDFLGNTGSVDFYVHADRLHAGSNYGKITVKSPYGEIAVPVVAEKFTGRRARHHASLRRKHMTFQMMEYYLAFRMKKISRLAWMEETEKILDEWRMAENKNPACRLFEAQLLITKGREEEARVLLEHIAGLLPAGETAEELRCYYLYLTTLIDRREERIRQVTEEIRTAYTIHSEKWRIAWLLLFLEEDLAKSPSRKWMFLEEVFKRSCKSPVIYIEAAELVSETPTLLMRLGRFEIQVLEFAARNSLLTPDIIGQLHYLAGRLKGYQEPVFRILKACYTVSRDEETLQAICTLLIKGAKTGTEYFPWYERGVEAGLRIMRLYEYYMMSVDLSYEGEIPRMVLMYFAYQSSLDYERNAFLYAYIVKRRETQPEMYRTYREHIAGFVEEQIRCGRINKDLAYLYKNMITPELVGKLAEKIVPLLFTNRLRVDNDNIKNIVVVYGKREGEESYPVAGGEAYPVLYGDDYKICLEDGQGSRYCAGIPFTLEKLLLPGQLVRECAPLVTDNLDLDLYLCLGGRSHVTVSPENEIRVRRLSCAYEIAPLYRMELVCLLLEYYFHEDKMGKLDQMLESASADGFSEKQRAAIIGLMITRELYDKAFSWLETYGAAGVDPKSIVRLCARLLEREPWLNKESFTNIVYNAFQQGKYNEQILRYLSRFFEGSVRKMRDIWKAARDFDVDNYEISERLLLQILFTGSYVGETAEIFSSYARAESNMEIVLAFLSYLSFEYFVKDRMMEGNIWDTAAQLYRRKEKLPFVVKAALLKYLSELAEYSDQDRELIASLTDEFLEQNIYFAFFKQFNGITPRLDGFAERTILEYRAAPDSKVILHYLIEGEEREANAYRREPMSHRYGGYFVKDFVLFFGEKLQYYITEESENGEQLTESAAVVSNDLGNGLLESRYGMINGIVTAVQLQDYDTFDELLKEYYIRDYEVQKLFTIV